MSFISGWIPNSKENGISVDEMCKRILDALPESALIVGEDTGIQASNQAASAAFGRGDGDLTGRRLPEVIRDLTLHKTFLDVIDKGETSEIEIELIGTESRRYLVSIAPIQLPGLKAAIGYFQDVTQKDRLEKMRQEFLSNVSHELRTPLTSILAFVETLEDGAIDDKDNNLRFLKVIQRNAERMHRLIDDILELSSIETGGVIIEPQRLTLGNIVTEIFTSLSGKARQLGVTLINKVPEVAEINADPARLEQMLVNLIDNAIKFNRQGGSVTLELHEEGGTSVISVSDTGEGISSEHLPRLFERFYRTDRARSREIGGTGLGLAICKHLAILHGGEVSVSSVLGEGSTFRIELPKN